MNTPASRQQWIYDLLKGKPDLSYEVMFTKYSLTFTKMSKRTFAKDWKKSSERFKDYQKTVQGEKEKVSIQEETEAVKNGIKTKNQRIEIYQGQINEILKELQEGTHEEITKKDDKTTKVVRSLTPSEKTAMRKAIKELQSEISKIEGDYAETKVKHSGDENSPIVVNSNVHVMTSSAPIANREEDVNTDRE